MTSIVGKDCSPAEKYSCDVPSANGAGDERARRSGMIQKGLRFAHEIFTFIVTQPTEGDVLAALSELLQPFSGTRLVEWFSDLTALCHDAAPIKPNDIESPKGLTQWIHYKNYIVWHLEEYVRKDEATESEILEAEKTIDMHSLKRLAAIEQIDIWLDNVLKSAGISLGGDAPVNSETPGSIIDRLSIITLKIFHIREHLEADDLSQKTRRNLDIRLSVLQEQYADLARALDILLLDLRQAKKRHKVYRQFKIYNDPSFQPNNS